MLHGRSNLDILDELDGHVAGHIEAKKALISLVNRSKIRHHQKWIEQIYKDYLIQPHKLLLLGQSGTGKTHMVECLHDIVDFPLVRVDATKLNPTGASGGVSEEALRKLIVKKAKEYCEIKRGYYHSIDGAIDQTVVFVDEIDKLGRSFDSSGNWNTHVQSNFLTLFDNKAEFAGVSFIFAGAFTEITNDNLNKSKPIGFNHPSDGVGKRDELDARVVKAGLIPELVGRLTSLVELDIFTVNDYYDILVQKLIPNKLIELAFFNTFDISLHEDQLQAMAKSAYNSGQGIRSLKRQLDREFMDVEFYNEYKLNKPKLLEGTGEKGGEGYDYNFED